MLTEKSFGEHMRCTAAQCCIGYHSGSFFLIYVGNGSHCLCSFLFAIPFYRNERTSTTVPRFLHLYLSKHVTHNASRLCLRAHTLKVEAAAWHFALYTRFYSLSQASAGSELI